MVKTRKYRRSTKFIKKRKIKNSRKDKQKTSRKKYSKVIDKIKRKDHLEEIAENYLEQLKFLIEQPNDTIEIGDTSLINKCNTKTSMSGKSGAYILTCDGNNKYIHKKWHPQNLSWILTKDQKCIICSPMLIEYIINAVIKSWADEMNYKTSIAYPECMRLTISNKKIQSNLIMKKANYSYEGENFVDLFQFFKFFVRGNRTDRDFKNFDKILESGLKNYINVYKKLVVRYNFAHTDCKMQNIFLGGKGENLILKISDLDKSCITIGSTTLVPTPSAAEKSFGASRYHRICIFDRNIGMKIDLKFLLADIYLVAKFYLKNHKDVITKLSKSLNILTNTIYGKDCSEVLTNSLLSRHIQLISAPPYLLSGSLQLFVMHVLNRIPTK